MVTIVDRQTILDAEPSIVTGVTWVWGDVGEDGKDELVRKFENCECGIGRINIRPKRPMLGTVLRQVWDAGGFVSGRVDGRRFLPRPSASLAKNAEVFSP